MLNSGANEIYIASCASWLPPTLFPVRKAVSENLYCKEDAKEMGYQSIAVAPKDIAVMDMAYYAGNKALLNANINGSDLEILIFNAIHRHGNPQLWCPASFMQKKLAAKESLPLTVNQGCNAQLLSIEVIRKILLSSEKDFGLVVAADKFSDSGMDRWRSDYGIVYGDAATAVVLSKKSGIAKIISLHTVSDPDLEALHRLEEAYAEQDHSYLQKNYNVRLAKKKFMQKFGKNIITDSTTNALDTLWQKTFSANNNPYDIRYFIFPNLAKNVLTSNYYSIFNHAEQRSLWEFGSRVGHLGASDCIAGLSYLLENNKLITGDKILCIGAGSGFSWTFMLIEMM